MTLHHVLMPIVASVMLALSSSAAMAQQDDDPLSREQARSELRERTDANDKDAESTATSEAEATSPQNALTAAEIEAKLERLRYIQEVISQKVDERSQLGTRIEQANEQDKDDLRRQADALTAEIKELRNTLANLAIGGVDDSLFVKREVSEESDWREDVALIAQPVIDSLKELTEKPRRLKELNDQIAEQQRRMEVADEALSNLQPQLSLEPDGDLGRNLDRIAGTWQKRRDEAVSKIQIAQIQIASLEGDKSLPLTIWESVVEFARGRGLTLLIAIGAAVGVWYGIRFLMRGYRTRLLDKSEPESRTRYRLAEYSVHLMTLLTILIAIFIVFYERGDVLLLGLLILLIVGLALGIRNLLPQYLREARLLLNIGPMREAERVLYRGLPWRVESINMYTVLRNPELHGVLRIPLAELHGVNSRPAGKDHWFPTSRGDVVLMGESSLVEVIDQNPDTVELRHRGGQLTTMPSPEFYAKSMTNLTRGGSFGVTTGFGVDYDQQGISVDQIPGILRSRIRETLEASDLSDFIKDVEVEMKQAGDSSLDYWLFATMDSRAAKSYWRIRRMMQTACIEACTENSWSIPFPHLSVVQKRGAVDSLLEN